MEITIKTKANISDTIYAIRHNTIHEYKVKDIQIKSGVNGNISGGYLVLYDCNGIILPEYEIYTNIDEILNYLKDNINIEWK